MKRKDILEGWGSRYSRYSRPSSFYSNQNSSDDDWGSLSKDEFKRRELEVELGHEDEYERQRRKGYYRPPEVKADYNLVNTATGKVLSKDGVPSVFTSERHAMAVAAKLKFGNWKAVPAKSQDVKEESGRNQIDPKSASLILQKMEQGVPMSNIIDEFPELHRMMEIIAGEQGLHMDDDFEDIEASLYHELEDIASSSDEEMKEMTPPGAMVGKVSGIDPATKKIKVTGTDNTTQMVDPKTLKPTADGKLQMDSPDSDEIKPGTTVVSTESNELFRIRKLSGL